MEFHHQPQAESARPPAQWPGAPCHKALRPKSSTMHPQFDAKSGRGCACQRPDRIQIHGGFQPFPQTLFFQLVISEQLPGFWNGMR